MKSIWFGLFAGVCLPSVLLRPVEAATTVTPVYSGIVRHSASNMSVNGRTVSYEVMVMDLTDPNLTFFLTPDNGGASGETTLQTTKNFAQAHVTEVAINTHFFTSTGGGGADVGGIAASNGTVYSPFESTGHLTALNLSAANFAELVMGPAGGSTFTSTASTPWTTVAPGTVLYRNGAVNNIGASDFRARTQIGLNRNGSTMMWFASKSGMTEQECAGILMNQFGAFHVFGLDGGGSTTMVLRTGTTTQSVIAIENSWSERAVGANLGVQAAAHVSGIPSVMSWDADPNTAGLQQGGGIWDFSASNWQASGVNRNWANPKTPIFGAGGGATITLGGRIAVTDMSVDGGYTLGAADGPSMTLLGTVTTTGSSPTVIHAPLHESTSFTKLGAQTLQLGTGSRISMLNLSEGVIDLNGKTFSLLDNLAPITFSGGRIQNGALIFTAVTSELSAPGGSSVVDADFTATRITKTGAGSVALQGANSWTGVLTVEDGTLAHGPSATFPTTAVLITKGLWDLAGASGSITTLKMGGVAGAASALHTGEGTLTLGGTLTYDATNDPAGAMINGALLLGGNRIFTVEDSAVAADDLTVNASIGGANSLSKNGEGTLVLGAENSFSSLTMISGRLRTSVANALPDVPITHRAGVIDLDGNDDTIGSLTMGAVANALPEFRTGEGTVTMNGNYTYSATNNGLGALITGTLLVSGNRTFTVNDSSNAVVDTRIEAAVEGNGTLTKKGAGRLVLAGGLTLAGKLTVDNGELLLEGPDSDLGDITLGGVAGVTATLDTGDTTLSCAGAIVYSNAGNGLGGILLGHVDLGDSPRTLTVNDSSNAPVDLQIGATLSGSGGFTKAGAGTLELSAENTLSGPVILSAGVLKLSHADALGAVPSLTLSGGATVDLSALVSATLLINRANLAVGGVGTLDGSVELSAGELRSLGTGLLLIDGNLTLSGAVTRVKVGTGAGGIEVSGAAVLGGDLVVSMGGTLSGTQKITLLRAASISGSFQSVSLPASPVGTTYRVAVEGNLLVLNVTPSTASEEWLRQQGLDPAQSLLVDTDDDGHLLVVEYALGGSVTAADVSWMQPEMQAGTFGIRFSYNPNATDIHLVVIGSSDLLTWSPILSRTLGGAWTGSAAFVQDPPVNGRVSIRVEDPVSGDIPRFLGIRVIIP